MWKKIKNLFKDNKKQKQKNQNPLSDKLTANIKKLRTMFTEVDDVRFRDITINCDENINTCLVYIEDLIDREILNDDIIKPLTRKQKTLQDINHSELAELLSEKVVNIEQIEKVDDIDQLAEDILQGNSILLIDKTRIALSCGTQGWAERAVSTPNVERDVRGPQEAFMENIKVNLGLIRRRVKSPDLKIVSFKKGKYSNTQISVLYLESVANSNIVREVKKRINDIETGQIIGCTHVEELIDNEPLSIFHTVYETERPDVIAAGILEGRVGILTDGCPTATMVPKLFMENFISPGDYYKKFWFTIPVRTMRFISYLVSTLLPALYVAIISFHQEVLPLTLARTIYTSRSGVPFPIFFELFLFLFLFEIIKEAGATVPTSLSTSITLVGTLILGQTAITARFLSADGVIIGSITGITIFLLPILEFSQSLLFLRFFYLLAAAIAGFYGISLAVIITLVHLASLRSVGVPFLSPVAPLQLKDLKDFFIRVPYLFMSSRPESLEGKNQTRQDNRPYRKYFFKYNLSEDQDKGEGED